MQAGSLSVFLNFFSTHFIQMECLLLYFIKRCLRVKCLMQKYSVMYKYRGQPTTKQMKKINNLGLQAKKIGKVSIVCIF